MGLGYAVRSRLGKYEPVVSDMYRGAFIDLDDLATTVISLDPDAIRVAEIGCGDGSMANGLVPRLTSIEYPGIALAPAPGRLLSGDRSRATFTSRRTRGLVATDEGSFSLVPVVGVVPHVADDQRLSLLTDAAALLRPGGILLFKDW